MNAIAVPPQPMQSIGSKPFATGTVAGTLPVQVTERREAVVRRLLAGADVAAIAAALAAGLLLTGGVDASGARYLQCLATLPFWIVLFKLYGLYDRDSKRVSHGTLDDAPWLFHALVMGTLALWALLKVAADQRLVLGEASVFFGVAMIGVLLARAAARTLAAARTPPERVLFAGAGPMTAVLMRKMRDHHEYGLRPVGYIGDDHDCPPGLPRLGGLGDLNEVIVAHGVNRVVALGPYVDEDALTGVVRRANQLGVPISLVPNLVDLLGPSVEIDDIEGITVLGLNPPTLSRSSRRLKRAMDVTLASVALVVLSPVMAAVAVAVRLSSPGPVLYTQVRVGRRGRHFELYKFRSMIAGAESQEERLQAQSADPNWLLLEVDPRITRVGLFLRLTSLDELPQLINVVRGDMSLVGPRPVTPQIHSRIDEWAHRRLDLTPGITGLWQVLGRTNIPFEEMLKLDYLYVTNWSLWNDVRLVIRTLPVVLRRQGAN